MSYDLFFALPADIAQDDVDAYFRQRRHYRVDGGATYENPDTGVYFSFAVDQGEASVEQSAGPQRRIAFNLNYFRPHIFGLEAEPEVSAFVERFNPMIEDPQVQGMANGPYSAEAFLRGWNCGNEVAYRSIIESHGKSNTFLTMPETAIEGAWRWNRAVPKMQAAHGQSVFVPKIMMLNVDGEAKSSVVWGDGIPTVTDRRNRAGDDRHNEASWNGPETRFRRVSRMRFFAGFCNGNFALESMIPTQRDRAFRFIVTGHCGRT